MLSPVRVRNTVKSPVRLPVRFRVNSQALSPAESLATLAGLEIKPVTSDSEVVEGFGIFDLPVGWRMRQEKSGWFVISDNTESDILLVFMPTRPQDKLPYVCTAR